MCVPTENHHQVLKQQTESKQQEQSIKPVSDQRSRSKYQFTGNKENHGTYQVPP